MATTSNAPALYKRPSSPFYYAILTDPKTGEPVRRSTGRETKREAVEAARDLQAELNQLADEEHERAKLRWSEVAEYYITHGNLTPATKEGYVACAIEVNRVLGDFDVAKLSDDDLTRFAHMRRRELVRRRGKTKPTTKPKRVSDSTIRRNISFISAAIRFAKENKLDGAPAVNVAAKFDRAFLKEAPLVDRYLRANQFEDLLNAFATDEQRRIMITLAGTGLRTGELTGLTWDNVDFKKDFLEFGNLQDTSGESTTKGRKSRRVPILAPVRKVLIEQVMARGYGDPDRPYARRPPRNALVFPSPKEMGRGEQARRGTFSNMVRAAREKVGLLNVRAHDMRHTFASWLLQQGVDPLAISAVLGHSTLSTTRRYARHISDSVAQQMRAIQLPLAAHSEAHGVGLDSESEGEEPES